MTVAQHRATIALNLKAEAVRRGHQPTAFIANVLGIHESTARRKLNGDTAFDTDEIAVLAAAFNVSPWSLVPDVPVAMPTRGADAA